MGGYSVMPNLSGDEAVGPRSFVIVIVPFGTFSLVGMVKVVFICSNVSIHKMPAKEHREAMEEERQAVKAAECAMAAANGSEMNQDNNQYKKSKLL